jgi:SAM-dependent methyltransferase
MTMTETMPRRRTGLHSHMGLFGVAGVAIGAALLILVPSLKMVSASLILFALFHLVGALVIGLSAYLAWGQRWAGRQSVVAFAAAPAWINGQLVTALACGGGAVAVQVAAPGLWPLAFSLVALAVLFAGGSRVAAGFRDADTAVLPASRLIRGDALDIGCGSGRSTLALARATDGAITAIDTSGNDARSARLARNLDLAGVAGRVAVYSGSLTALLFADASFDTIVAVNALDHRRGDAQAILGDARRLLRRDGTLVMVVRVPGWATVQMISLLCLALPSRAIWRQTVAAAGYRCVESGTIGNGWYLLLQSEG